MRTSTSSIPYCGMIFRASARIVRVISSRPRVICLLELLLPLRRDLLQHLALGDFPRGAADELDELAARHLVPDHRVDDVVQARLRPCFRGHVLQKLLGIGDAPARRGVHPDELPPFGGNLVRVAIPDEEALLEASHLLHEGELDVQSRLGHRLPHGPAELHDDRLLALLQGVERAREHEEDRHHDDDDRYLQRCSSRLSPFRAAGLRHPTPGRARAPWPSDRCPRYTAPSSPPGSCPAPPGTGAGA